MDPIAHTFTGAALAATGLRRATPLATAALVIGANAPDIDVLASFAGSYAALALRRGWTHGVLAIVVLPFVVTGLLLLWDRMRPGRAERAPARAGPLLALAALAVLTHPTLDWLNNYGMRWLMPFDGRWSYGDALFIVDPWVWLALGGVLFLGGSRSPWAFALWVVFWLLGTWLLFSVPFVPAPSRTLWAVTVAALFAVRLFRAETLRPIRPGQTRAHRARLRDRVHGDRSRRKRGRPPRGACHARRSRHRAGDGRDGRSRRRESVRGHGRRGDAGVVPPWRVALVRQAAIAAQPAADRATCERSDSGGREPDTGGARLSHLVAVSVLRGRAGRDEEDGYVVRLRDARYHGLGLEGPTCASTASWSRWRRSSQDC